MSERRGTLSLAEATQLGRKPDRKAGLSWAGLFVWRFSPRLSWAIVRHTSLSADGVTALSILAGLVAAALVLPQRPEANVAAVLLLQLAYIFDCVDGEVARIRGTAGLRGKYLDLIGHMIQNRALYAAAAIVLIDVAGGAWWAIGLGLLAIGFTEPIGVHAAEHVLSRSFGSIGHASVGSDPAGEDSQGATTRPSLIGGLYRRVAFMWNHPASMNLFCVVLLLDAAALAANVTARPVVLPAFFVVFGATLGLRQIAHAIRLLWAIDWRHAVVSGG